MKVMLSLAGLAALASVSFVSPPAQAAGCGGYVNVFVHGCAPWDNNPRRMPGAPGYTAPRAAAPVVAPPPARIVQPATGNRFISDQGAGLISNGRGGLVGNDGASMRNNRLIGNDGSTFISTNGSTMRR